MDNYIEKKVIVYTIDMPHIEYYEMMIHSLNSYIELVEIAKRIHSKNENAVYTLEEKKENQLLRGISRYNLILYAALSLEAFINYYGVLHNISFVKELDFKTINKWRGISQTIN